MRAEVIKKYLVDKGISAARIETVGMGPKNPIASNETFEGRKLNRRIEIKFKLK
jgi:outer membrane protein OmpA-like peptidoglycan-associated protein